MTTLAVVALTVYAGPYVNQPLYCGGVYTTTTAPWVAMPIRDYGITWECGDTIGILADGEVRTFLALDAGPFGAYCVMQPDGSCPEIGADVPKPHWWKPGKLSTIGMVYNVSALQRVWEQYR